MDENVQVTLQFCKKNTILVGWKYKSNKFFWLRMARMEVDCTLKKLNNFFHAIHLRLGKKSLFNATMAGYLFEELLAPTQSLLGKSYYPPPEKIMTSLNTIAWEV